MPTLQDEVAYLTGVTSTGTVTSTSYWGQNGETAHKWGGTIAGSAGGTVTYYFSPSSNFSAAEKATFVEAFALWSAVANIQFAVTTNVSTANVVLERGSDGNAYEEDGAVTVGSGSTLGHPTGQSVISIDTSVYGFDLSGSFTQAGGYGLSTVIHEIGHLLGLGHAGDYNGNVNSATQQYSPYDSRLWTLMSYIDPTDSAAKYYSSYPVTGTNWGTYTDSSGTGDKQSSDSWMPLDILAAQRLYGVATGGPLSGGQIFGFNSNIVGPIEPIFDFTKDTIPVVTLYDTGIGNTLDLSGWSSNDTINLTPGTFSGADGMTNNIAIAFGTTIDNVIGGSGNDSITGNTVAGATNHIDGGTGNDTLIGGGAHDTLIGNGFDSMVGSTVAGAANYFYDLHHGTTTMRGGAAATNSFFADGGHDVIYGGNLGDSISLAGGGHDSAFAGSGSDFIVGASSSDYLSLGGGNDTVWSQGANNDVIVGGAGNKTLFVGGAYGTVTQVTGGSGNDTISGLLDAGSLFVTPGTGSGINVVDGGTYSNHIYGNNTTGILWEQGGAGTDELVGGQGNNHFKMTGGGDFLTGHGQSNAYMFSDLAGSNNHIYNFNAATDIFAFNTQSFSGFTAGETLTLGVNLINGTTETTNAATFIYDGAGLYYDADGAGPGQAKLVAGLATGPATLSAANFFFQNGAF